MGKPAFLLSSELIRAARALLRWEQRDLSHASSVSLPTIKRLELKPGLMAAHEFDCDGTPESAGIRRRGVHRRKRRRSRGAVTGATAKERITGSEQTALSSGLRPNLHVSLSTAAYWTGPAGVDGRLCT